MTIEERHFYPNVREKHTEDLLLESLEELKDSASDSRPRAPRGRKK